jgi:hypothetical protein
MTFFDRLFTLNRHLRVGDLVWLRPKDGIEETQAGLNFVKVWFPKMARSGSARVIEVDTLPRLMFWAREVRVPESTLRPLNRLGSWLAWDRAGQALFEREVMASLPPNDDPAYPGPAPVQTPAAERTAHARGGLPLIAAFGGTHRSYQGFWLHRFVQQVLRRLTRWPNPGYLDDSGVLVDRCTATLRFSYDGKPRRFRLDQIRRHPNGKFHLSGRLLPSGEARTFSYHGVDALAVEGQAPLNRQQLWVELHGLTTSAVQHHMIWANWCRTNRIPLPPPPDARARWEERLRVIIVRLRHLPYRLTHLGYVARWHRLIEKSKRKPGRVGRSAWLQRLVNWVVWLRAELKPLPPSRRDVVGLKAGWRRRTARGAYWIERGMTVDARALRYLSFLSRDTHFARALLRAILRYESRQQTLDHPDQIWIARALAVSPEGRRVIRWDEQEAAQDLYTELQAQLICLWSWQHRGTYDRKDRVRLLVARFLTAIYQSQFVLYGSSEGFPDQEISPWAFREMLMLFAADHDGQDWILTLPCARRWRWLAAFEPGVPDW